MRNEVLIGSYAISNAGHDFGKWYVIFDIEDEYVYLVDGKIRTLNRPKKKKIKHMIFSGQFDEELSDKVKDRTAKNEEIKKALKLMQGNLGKEVG